MVVVISVNTNSIALVLELYLILWCLVVISLPVTPVSKLAISATKAAGASTARHKHGANAEKSRYHGPILKKWAVTRKTGSDDGTMWLHDREDEALPQNDYLLVKSWPQSRICI